MIQLRSVTKKYKNNYALKNINLDDLSMQQINEIRNFFDVNYPQGAYS